MSIELGESGESVSPAAEHQYLLIPSLISRKLHGWNFNSESIFNSLPQPLTINAEPGFIDVVASLVL